MPWLCLLLAANPAPQPLTLSQATALAQVRGPELIEARAAVPVASAQVEVAAQWPNPTASVSVGPDSPQIVAGLAQRLPVFGQLGSAIHAAQAGVTVAKVSLELRRLQALTQLRRTYFALVHAQASGKLAEERTARAGLLARMTRERFDAGTASQLEVAQASLFEQRARQAQQDREADTRAAREELAVAVGWSDGSRVEATDALLPEPLAPALEPLLVRAAQHPEVQLSQSQALAARARADREGAALRPLPEVSVAGESFTRDEAQAVTSLRPLLLGNAVGLRTGIAFDLPIASQNQGAIHAAQREAEQAEAAAGAALQRHLAQARVAYVRWEAASRRSRFLQETLIPQALQVEAMARVAYAAGRTPLTAVLQTQADATDVQEEAVTAATAAQVAYADIEEAIGILF